METLISKLANITGRLLPFAAAILIAGLPPVLAQTQVSPSTPSQEQAPEQTEQPAQQQPSTEQPAAENTEAEESETESAETENPETESPEAQLQEELDGLIIGPWVRISESFDAKLDSSSVLNAVRRCTQVIQLGELQIQRGAERSLPDRTQLFGDLIYYRTDRGLQRLESASGRLVVLTRNEKTTTNSGNTVWRLGGRAFSTPVRFADTSARGGTAEFMIERGGFYMRCPKIELPEESQ